MPIDVLNSANPTTLFVTKLIIRIERSWTVRLVELVSQLSGLVGMAELAMKLSRYFIYYGAAIC